MQFEKKETKNMKYLLSLMLSVSALFGFGECEKCAKVPFSVLADFSKKGTVYETDFQAPWNIWGSLVGFYIGASYFFNSDIKSFSQLTKEQEMISDFISGSATLQHPLYKEIMSKNQYFKIKITLTPLDLASEEVKVILDSKEWSERKEKNYTKGQKIEEIVLIPLYGGNKGSYKTIIIADLQRLRNYHVRVESMEDVELPKGVSTGFMINRFSTKH